MADPWKKYSEFSIIPDFVDQHGRHYALASERVRTAFPSEDLVLEIKIPIRRPPLRHNDFPRIGERLILGAYGMRTRVAHVGDVGEIYFRPRGATGVCILELK